MQDRTRCLHACQARQKNLRSWRPSLLVHSQNPIATRARISGDSTVEHCHGLDRSTLGDDDAPRVAGHGACGKQHKKSTLPNSPWSCARCCLQPGANRCVRWHGPTATTCKSLARNFSEKRLTPIKTVIRFRPNAAPAHHQASEPVIATKRTTTRSPARTPQRMVEGFASPEETQHLIRRGICPSCAAVLIWAGAGHRPWPTSNRIRPSALGASAAACGSDSRGVSSTGLGTGCFMQSNH